MTDVRITPSMPPGEGLRLLRESAGYFITNTARDLSQSDFKNRILVHSDLLVAEERDEAGFFSLEITGGASVHVDLLRKQVNPFTKLELLRRHMPNTMFQTLCRGINLFGYRPYPENVIRLTVQTFAKFVEVWRVFDFLNHVPNMIPVFEEVKTAGKYLEPSLCFSTGPEHTNEFYVKKAGEILAVTGPEIILAIKNHSGLGSPARIYQLVRALLDAYPDLIIHYHGHNTDGNDIARVLAAVKAGAKIIDAGDHAMTGFFGPPPMLTLIMALEEEGYKANGINIDAIIAANETLKRVRPAYAAFESQFKGFDPTVHTHKLPGGAMGSSFEQAVKGGFLARMPDILHRELPTVHRELGNFWSVTPGSQILWTTAVTHTLSGIRYENASNDLKNLLLERYGPFPFQRPSDDIYQKVFGSQWEKTVKNECGPEDCPEVNIETERNNLELALGRKASTEELTLYLQHPRDALDFWSFEKEYGKTYVLPPEIWFREGGFVNGEIISMTDFRGRMHQISIGPTQKVNGGLLTYLQVDHHPEPFLYRPESETLSSSKKQLTLEELNALAEMGEIRALINGVILEINVIPGDEVEIGQPLLTMEAMKMMTSVASPLHGVIKEVTVKPSQAVTIGDLLINIRPGSLA